MSACPQITLPVDSSPPPPRGLGFIPLDEAARRAGKVIGHIARLCRSKWAAQGLAELRTPPGGGKREWHVREDADPSFARVQTPDQIPCNLAAYPLAVRERVLEREKLLSEWERAIERRGPGVNKLAASIEFCRLLADIDGKRVSPRTLGLWQAAYRINGRSGLVDDRLHRSGGAAAAREENPFLQEVKRLYLNQRGRSKQLCYDRACDAAAEQSWTVCSYKTACRFLDRIDKRTVALHRGGEEAYAAAASCNTRDYKSIASNDVWISDHHRFDVICKIGVDAEGKPKYGRPWLTAWMDMRSRMLVGWQVFAHDPNADTIIGTFKIGCKSHGAPWHVLIDNGKDYDSYALQGMTKRQRLARGKKPLALIDAGIFGRVQVKVMHARPYRPQSKTIERFFGTVADRFARLFETYCGNSTSNRPADLYGEHGQPGILDRHNAPTVDELAASFADWLDADYHHQPHSGDGMEGMAPAAVFANELKRKRVLADWQLAELDERTRPVKVGRNGVRFGKLTYGRNHPALVKLLGQKVTLGVDKDDVAQLRVYAMDGRQLCTVSANEKMPVLADKQAVREAVAGERRDRKTAKAGHVARMRLGRSITDRLYLKAAELRRQNTSEPSTNEAALIPVQTGFADPMNALRDAVDVADQRGPIPIAAGAESVRLDDLGRVFASYDPDDDGVVAGYEDPFTQLSQVLADGET